MVDWIDEAVSYERLKQIESLTEALAAKDARISAQSATIIRLGEELAKAERERDEACELAVWAARHSVSWVPPDGQLAGRMYWFAVNGDREWLKWDGTDADIHRALREAMEGCE